MRRSLVLSLAWLALGGGLSTPVAVAHVDRPCPCTYPGGIAQQGEVVCLEVAGQRQLARCEMVLNNSSWHFLGTPCSPTAKLGPRHPTLS
ncbi:MAG TPA: hypothetical protein VHL31_18870 [Geminicoccus sp.]|jgi:hypothetical protein|uniref:hypothetical protein n=1 Tax=Geminicoccus sp. TaxID=2024832 RepID=UPI002E333299|nr:hypothetical protein [Geminicoccus sp.]HEX2528350.1 hypothetical protein [Geminicoccus sp.]